MNPSVPIRRLHVLLVLGFTALALTATLASSAQAAPEFQAGKYPATIHGTGSLGVFKLWTNGGNVECKNEFDGVLAGAATTLKFTVSYAECKAFGFLEATVNTEGCQWVMHGSKHTSKDDIQAFLSLECAAGKSIKVSVFTCAAEIKSQTGLSPAKLTNDTGALPAKDVTFKPEVKSGVKYTVTKDGFGCPLLGLGEKSDGELTSTEGITLTGTGTTFQISDPVHLAETHAAATTVRTHVEHSEHKLDTEVPAASEFTAGKYPAIVHGSNSAGILKLVTEGNTVQCANSYFGEAAGASSTLDLAVTYASCANFGAGEAVTVNPEGCGFRLHGIEPVAKDEYSGRLGIKCGLEESIKITTTNCSLELQEQGPLSSVKLIDDTAASPVENVTLKAEVKSVKYTVTRDDGACPLSGIGTKTSGEMTTSSNITLTAQSPVNPSEKIAFRIGEHADLTAHEAKTHEEKTTVEEEEAHTKVTAHEKATAHEKDTAHEKATTKHAEETKHEEETTTPRFKAAKYPVTVHGSGKVGVFAFTTNGGSIECLNTFHGNLSEASTTLKLAVTYTECKAFGFLGATVNTEGCQFVTHVTEKVTTDEYKAHLGLECPVGKSIKVSVSNCAAEYKAQTGMTTVRLNDDTAASPAKDITYDPEVPTGFKYIVTKDGFACPLNGTGEKTDGQITSAEGITLTGQNPSNASEKIGFEVG